MKNKTRALAGTCLLAASFLLTFSSCKKDGGDANNPASINDAVEASAAHYSSSQLVNGIYSVQIQQFIDAASSMARTSQSALDQPCFTTSIETTNGLFPATVITDFRTGCKDANNVTRSGKIKSVFSDFMLRSGTKVVTTFDGYQVDSFKISGTVELTTEVDFDANRFDVKLNAMQLKATHLRTGYSSEVSGEILYSQLKDVNIYLFDLNPFETSGSLHGETSLGLKWTAEVEKPVLRSFDCIWPQKGVVSLVWNSNKDKAYIDYGDGTCDNKAEVTYKSYKSSVNL